MASGSCVPHQQAEHMTAPTRLCITYLKTLAIGAPSTHDPKRTLPPVEQNDRLCSRPLLPPRVLKNLRSLTNAAAIVTRGALGRISTAPEQEILCNEQRFRSTNYERVMVSHRFAQGHARKPVQPRGATMRTTSGL